MSRMFWAGAILCALIASPMAGNAAPQQSAKAPAKSSVKAAPAKKPAKASKQAARPAKAPAAPVELSPVRKGPVSEDVVRADLDVFVRNYITRSNHTLSINRSKPRVFKRGKMWVATFTEADVNSARTSMKKSASKYFDYVATLSYEEITYECVGKTQGEALNGKFVGVKMRRLTELPRYVKGKWEN